MSANSNQSPPPAVPVSQETQQTTPQGEIQAPALTEEQIDARIADGVAKGIAAYNQQEAEKKAAAELAEQKVAERAQKALEAQKPKSTWPFGNKDIDHEFDLSTMTNWTGLPDDKVLIVIPKFNTDGNGNKTGYDVKNSLIQTVDPLAHKQQITPDKNTGATTYGMLGITPVVIHDPSK